MNDALLTQIYVCIYNDVIAEKKKKVSLDFRFSMSNIFVAMNTTMSCV